MKKLKKAIRYNALRIALVDAIIASSECTLENGLCTCDSCGALDRLLGITGLKNADTSGRRALKYSDAELVGSSANDALEVLNIQHKHHLYKNSLSEIFDGFMEFPSGAYPAYAYHQEITQEGSENFALWYENSQLSAKRQIAFILVSLALPDSYLDNFVNELDDRQEDEKEWNSQENWNKWCKIFQEQNLPIINLPSSITQYFTEDGPWTSLFGEHADWHEAAGYEIAFGRKEGDVMSGELSLKELVERYPSVQGFFTWCWRGNEAGNFGGFLVRSEGLLVSQTWTTEAFTNNDEANRFHINTFNEHLAPFLENEPQSEFDRVIVVYSDYSGYAYILSSDPRSWNANAPSDRIPGPFPDGYGLVDNWDHPSDQYQPRPLTAFDTDLFTPRLRSAARFLAECISHNQQRPPQIL